MLEAAKREGGTCVEGGVIKRVDDRGLCGLCELSRRGELRNGKCVFHFHLWDYSRCNGGSAFDGGRESGGGRQQ